MRYAIIAAFLIGCTPETTLEPSMNESERAALLHQKPPCVNRAQAFPFDHITQIASWYDVTPPEGMEVQFCHGTDEELPNNCTWFDHQPDISTAACPLADTPPLTCDVDSDCPASPDECWEPYCSWYPGGNRCMLTGAFKIGAWCAGGSGICMQRGEQLDENGLWISLHGWPIVCTSVAE